MVKRVLRRDARKCLEGNIAEGAAGRGECHAANLRQILSDEALPEPVVLAVDRAKTIQRLAPDRTGGPEDRETDRSGHQPIIPSDPSGRLRARQAAPRRSANRYGPAPLRDRAEGFPSPSRPHGA